MKKIVTSVLLFLVLSIVMCGCGKSVKTQELSENIEAYKKIAEIAIKDFQDEEHKEGTRWIADMSEFSEYDDLKTSLDIAEKEFDFLWIEGIVTQLDLRAIIRHKNNRLAESGGYFCKIKGM